MVIGDQSHIFIYFPDGRLLLGFGIVVCRAKGFSLTEAPTERRPPKVAWGHRRIGVTGGLAKSFWGVWRNFEKNSRAMGGRAINCGRKPFRLPLRDRGLSERRMPRTTRRSSLLEGPAPSGPLKKPVPHEGAKARSLAQPSLSLPPILVRRRGARPGRAGGRSPVFSARGRRRGFRGRCGGPRS